MVIDPAFAVAGALTGFVVGLTGVGGGALMTPILLLVFNMVPATAVATDLWFAVLTKLAAVAVHQRAGQVDWQVARRLWAGSLPAAVLVVVYVSVLGAVHRIDWLTKAIGGAVILTAVSLLFARHFTEAAKRAGGGQRHEGRLAWLTVAAGAGLGLCVSLTSVGAGALGSVILLYLYPVRLTPHRLVATDIVHAIPLAAVAGTGYLVAGLVDLRLLTNLLVGSVPAVIAGSLLATRTSGHWLRVFVAIVLGIVGVKTLF